MYLQEALHNRTWSPGFWHRDWKTYMDFFAWLRYHKYTSYCAEYGEQSSSSHWLQSYLIRWGYTVILGYESYSMRQCGDEYHRTAVKSVLLSLLLGVGVRESLF